MCPEKALEEVEALRLDGMVVDLVESSGQCYARVRGLTAPSPPWGSEDVDILIAVPAVYDLAGLDGLYVRLPYTFNGGTHPRVENGSIISVEGEEWRQVSWHYADGKPWITGQDNLETHIQHCSGFFRQRGATNDYR